MKHGVCQSDVINNVGEAVNWSTFETHIYFSAPNSPVTTYLVSTHCI